MYFLAVAADYDGTIAHDGIVDEATLAAFQRLKETLLSRDNGPGRQILRKFNTETVNASGIASDEWSLLRPMEPVGMRRCAPAGLYELCVLAN
jgi:hypothetical protein